MTQKMPEKSNISIYLRLRPTNEPSDWMQLEGEENRVDFRVPKDQAMGYVNNQREHYAFRFNGIFDGGAKQDKVFDDVAKDVVLGSLEGKNGTIFAYGQTGSGKTFTITGGPDRYMDRGLIPRAISLVFSEVARRTDHVFTVHVSYLEIYNEMVYDLLDPDREIKELEDLPRVLVREDEDSQLVLQNLRMCKAGNEEEALGLLFLGDTNRTISETPMNMASSRSHCIFTVYVEARKIGEEVVRRSKLNLVDLAGSERVKKTGIDGTTLTEARHINLALHFLEQVIIALQERSVGVKRPHIPYRNSNMTMVLRDSLGGNCHTVMIATVSAETRQMDETISTCRFAQRVAMVSNEMVVNEEVDPQLVIRRLKQEIHDLKQELKILKGEGAERGPLTPEEEEKLTEAVEAYCKDSSQQAVLNISEGMVGIRAGFRIMKGMVRKGGRLQRNGESDEADGGKPEDQVRRLRLQVQQRDNEIGVLVSMLKKKEGNRISNPLPHNAEQSQENNPASSNKVASGSNEQPAVNLLNVDVLADRNKAFELFRKSYRRNQAIEDNKAQLKKKYEAAKETGQILSASKKRISELRAVIEQRRLKRCVAKVSKGGDPSLDEDEKDPEEEKANAQLSKEKARYKEAFYALRDLKKEIEHLQMLLEQSRVRLQKDFQHWFGVMSRQQQGRGDSAGNQDENKADTPTDRNVSVERLSAKPRVAWEESANTVGSSTKPSSTPVSTKSQTFKDSYISSLGVGEVENDVLQAATPLLTGNPDADRDIVKFYEARAKLLKSQKSGI